MKAFSYILLVLFGALLIYASLSLPRRGDPDAPIHRDKSVLGSPGASAHYVRNAYKDAATPNMVTVVLADYRSFDTLGETVVVFAAGIACVLILGRRRQ